MEPELFTVGILSYNQQEYIFSCVDSILCQDYPAIELIISDDCSEGYDDEALRMYIEKHRRPNLRKFHLNKMPSNVGTVKNNNYVLSHADGSFLKLIAADDRLRVSSALSEVATALATKDCGVLCARASVCNRDGGEVSGAIYPGEEDFREIESAFPDKMYRILSDRPWSIVFAPAMFWRTSFLRDIGGFDEDYRYTEDWPLFLKLSGIGVKICTLDSLLVTYRLGGISNPERRREFSELRWAHYEECIRLLKDTAFPLLLRKASFITASRCRLSYRYLKYRIIRECRWDELGTVKRFMSRLFYLLPIMYVRILKPPG